MAKETKKILFSGIKPTGRPHIGNYLGAMRQFVNLQDEFESYFMIADYHALTTTHNAEELSQNTLDIAIDYLAIGLDPKEVIIFKQSALPQHTELAWIFSCITPVPYLKRAHAYKDAIEKGVEVNAGTFSYPMLMAADILLYDAEIVPVGQDQKQHIEIARETAEKFNRIFGDIFIKPSEKIIKDSQIVLGADGKKMSKSHNNTLPLFAEDSLIEKFVMGVVTDSKGETEPKDPLECTVFSLHKFFSGSELGILEGRYKDGKIGYHESKKILIENIKRFVAPLREKRSRIADDKGYVATVLEEGRRKATEQSEEKMQIVRKKVGVSAY